MTHTAKTHWSGSIKEGKGTLSTQSGVLSNINFSYKTHFENEEKATNPEELLAAAHVACFTITVGSMLKQKGIIPTTLDAEAILSMDGWKIVSIHLIIKGLLTGISAEDFATITKEAEKNCLISKVLNIPITSEVHFLT
jgi:lipoyl-dependent peroxiredoxin